MAAPGRLMALGMAAALANEIGLDAQPAGPLLTATGSNIATALTLAADFNLFGTVAAGTGCQVPAAEGQPEQVLFNGGANALLIYPQSNEIINAGTVGQAFSLAAGKGAILVPGKNTAVTPPIGAYIAISST
jgi:hypothetical protein